MVAEILSLCFAAGFCKRGTRSGRLCKVFCHPRQHLQKISTFYGLKWVQWVWSYSVEWYITLTSNPLKWHSKNTTLQCGLKIITSPIIIYVTIIILLCPFHLHM